MVRMNIGGVHGVVEVVVKSKKVEHADFFD